MPPPDSRERGIATVWTAAAIAGLLVVAAFAFWLGAAVIARHRASGAADLAALAAAGELQRAGAGHDSGCGRAAEVVQRMRVRLAGCRFEGWDALVEVECDLPGVLSRFGTGGGRARAGPVDRPP